MTARGVPGVVVQHVEFMPADLAEGVLYVSLPFATATHLCCCGCGLRVVTPLSPVDWVLREEQRGPTLVPSISNSDYPCRSHYWITRGEVEWSYQLSPRQVEMSREYTARARQTYAAATQGRRTPVQRNALPWWRRLARRLWRAVTARSGE